MSEPCIEIISDEPDGSVSKTTMSKEKFIENYRRSYFLEQGRKVSGTRQNSRFVETQIEGILKEGISSEEDVVKILAWKIGKIKHKDSEKIQKFKYASDWERAENGDFSGLKLYGGSFDVVPFASYIVEHREELENELKNDPSGAQRVINTLKTQSQSLGNRMGTVYLITILYFLSRGDYPIYDRFAKIAIDAICGCAVPVQYKPLASKNEKEFDNVINDYIENYVNKLRSVFGDKYNSRDVDRALWVYGHTKALRGDSLNKKAQDCC